jgi:hypothetical protein
VQTLQHTLAVLKADNANLPKYQAQLAAAQQALPDDPGLSDFLREMQTDGAATGVSVTNISIGQPTAVTATAASGTTTADGGVTGPVYSVGIVLTANGTADGVNGFLKELQQTQKRAVLLVSANEVPAPGSTQTALTVNLEAFVAPSTDSSSTTTAN